MSTVDSNDCSGLASHLQSSSPDSDHTDSDSDSDSDSNTDCDDTEPINGGSTSAATIGAKRKFSHISQLSSTSTSTNHKLLSTIHKKRPKPKSKKRRIVCKRLPPPPTDLLLLHQREHSANNINDNNNNAVKCPRLRRYAHVTGNWAVHIFISVENVHTRSVFDAYADKLLKAVLNLDLEQPQQRTQSATQMSLNMGIGSRGNRNTNVMNVQPQPLLQPPPQNAYVKCGNIHDQHSYHISLSISQPIRKHQIPAFVECITKLIQKHAVFDVSFSNHNQHKHIQEQKNNRTPSANHHNSGGNANANESESENENGIALKCFDSLNDGQIQRKFVSILVNENYGKTEILSLLESINAGFKQWSLKPFHANVEPHISLLWTTMDSRSKVSNVSGSTLMAYFDDQSQLPSVLTSGTASSTYASSALVMHVNKVQIKIGNRLYSVSLIKR